MLDPAEAPIVAEIFQRHERGAGISVLAKQLNEEGKKPKRGRLWYASGVHKILTNEVYVGRYFYRPTDVFTRETLPREHWIEIPCPRLSTS